MSKWHYNLANFGNKIRPTLEMKFSQLWKQIFIKFYLYEIYFVLLQRENMMLNEEVQTKNCR